MNGLGSSFSFQGGQWSHNQLETTGDEWQRNDLLERSRRDKIFGVFDTENEDKSDNLYGNRSGGREGKQNWNLSKVITKSYLVNSLIDGTPKFSKQNDTNKEKLNFILQDLQKEKSSLTDRIDKSQSFLASNQNNIVQKNHVQSLNSSNPDLIKGIQRFQENIKLPIDSHKKNKKEAKESLSFKSNIINSDYNQGNNAQKVTLEQQIKARQSQKLNKSQTKESLSLTKFKEVKDNRSLEQVIPQNINKILPEVRQAVITPLKINFQYSQSKNLNESGGDLKYYGKQPFLTNSNQKSKNNNFINAARTLSFPNKKMNREVTEQDSDYFLDSEKQLYQMRSQRTYENKSLVQFSKNSTIMSSSSSGQLLNKTGKNFKIKSPREQMNKTSGGNQRWYQRIQSDEEEIKEQTPKIVMTNKAKLEDKKPYENLKFFFEKQGGKIKKQIVKGILDRQKREENQKENSIESDQINSPLKLAKDECFEKQKEELESKEKNLQKMMEDIQLREGRLEVEKRKFKELEQAQMKNIKILESTLKQELIIKNQQDEEKRQEQLKNMYDHIKQVEEDKKMIEKAKVEEEMKRKEEEQKAKEIIQNKVKELDNLKLQMEEESKRKQKDIQIQLEILREEEINNIKMQMLEREKFKEKEMMEREQKRIKQLKEEELKLEQLKIQLENYKESQKQEQKEIHPTKKEIKSSEQVRDESEKEQAQTEQKKRQDDSKAEENNLLLNQNKQKQQKEQEEENKKQKVRLLKNYLKEEVIIEDSKRDHNIQKNKEQLIINAQANNSNLSEQENKNNQKFNDEKSGVLKNSLYNSSAKNENLQNDSETEEEKLDFPDRLSQNNENAEQNQYADEIQLKEESLLKQQSEFQSYLKKNNQKISPSYEQEILEKNNEDSDYSNLNSKREIMNKERTQISSQDALDTQEQRKEENSQNRSQISNSNIKNEVFNGENNYSSSSANNKPIKTEQPLTLESKTIQFEQNTSQENENNVLIQEPIQKARDNSINVPLKNQNYPALLNKENNEEQKFPPFQESVIINIVPPDRNPHEINEWNTQKIKNNNNSPSLFKIQSEKPVNPEDEQNVSSPQESEKIINNNQQRRTNQKVYNDVYSSPQSSKNNFSYLQSQIDKLKNRERQSLQHSPIQSRRSHANKLLDENATQQVSQYVQQILSTYVATDGENSKQKSSLLTIGQINQIREQRKYSQINIKALSLSDQQEVNHFEQEIYGNNTKQNQNDYEINFNKRNFDSNISKFTLEAKENSEFNLDGQVGSKFLMLKIQEQKQETPFQKEVKTLLRKVNQYFKTKFHLDQEQLNDEEEENRFRQTSIHMDNFDSLSKSEKEINLNIKFKINEEDEGEGEESYLLLQKSDIKKLNEKLSIKEKNESLTKLFKVKSEEEIEKEASILEGKIMKPIEKQNNQNIEKQNNQSIEKQNSQKIVIQVNPPIEEIQSPEISQEQKKQGQIYEFKFEENKNKNKKENEGQELENDKNNKNSQQVSIGDNQIFKFSKNKEGIKVFENYETSYDEWIQNLEQNYQISKNLQNKYSDNSSNKKRKSDNSSLQSSISARSSFAPSPHLNQSRLSNSECILQKLNCSLKFVHINQWKFIKAYSLSYLKLEIDQKFLHQIKNLPEYLSAIIKKVDISGDSKFQQIIPFTSEASEQFFKEVYLKNIESLKSYLSVSKFFKQSFIENSQQERENFEHEFNLDLVDSEGLCFIKRNNSLNNSNDQISLSSNSFMEDDNEEYEEDDIFENDDNGKYPYIMDEQQYEGKMQFKMLEKGYHEYINVSESTNLLKLLTEQIGPVISGIDNSYVSQILKQKKSHKKAKGKDPRCVVKKTSKLRRIFEKFDLKSRQSYVNTISNYHKLLLEGDFNDHMNIDHEFFKNEFISQQQAQLSNFLTYQYDSKRKKKHEQNNFNQNKDKFLGTIMNENFTRQPTIPLQVAQIQNQQNNNIGLSAASLQQNQTQNNGIPSPTASVSIQFQQPQYFSQKLIEQTTLPNLNVLNNQNHILQQNSPTNIGINLSSATLPNQSNILKLNQVKGFNSNLKSVSQQQTVPLQTPQRLDSQLKNQSNIRFDEIKVINENQAIPPINNSLDDRQSTSIVYGSSAQNKSNCNKIGDQILSRTSQSIKTEGDFNPPISQLQRRSTLFKQISPLPQSYQQQNNSIQNHSTLITNSLSSNLYGNSIYSKQQTINSTNTLRSQNDQEKQIDNQGTLSNLISAKEKDTTSMDKSNLIVRNRIQQNLKKLQMNLAEQVFYAIQENNIHEVENILNQFQTLSLESRDNNGNTFLILAAQVGSTQIIQYLLSKGVNVNAKNNDGDTALHKANFYSYHAASDLLIQNGASQNSLNNASLNPWGQHQ